MVDLPAMSLEFGFATTAAVGIYLVLDDPVRGKLGTGTLGPDLLWTDVAADLIAWELHRTSTRVVGPITRYEAGTASYRLSNAQRQYDPTNLDGPYVSVGVTQVTPMRAVRLRATWAGITYELWRGFVDAWRLSYDMPQWSEVVATATDAFKILNYDRAAVSPVGAGEDSGARVARILDTTGWPGEDRILDAGDSDLQATELGGNALSELQATVDSELGDLYVDGAGRVVFRSRHATLTDTRSATSQHTFGLGGLLYSSLTPEYDDTQLINLVRATISGGVEQTAQDTASRDQYLTHTAQNSSLLLATDAEALQWAQWIVYQSKDPELRFSQLIVQPQRDAANLYPAVLGMELGDRITVQLQPPGGGDPISQDVFVRSIEHTVNQQHQWTTQLGLQSAAKYAFLVLDNSVTGRLDFNALVF